MTKRQISNYKSNLRIGSLGFRIKWQVPLQILKDIEKIGQTISLSHRLLN